MSMPSGTVAVVVVCLIITIIVIGGGLYIIYYLVKNGKREEREQRAGRLEAAARRNLNVDLDTENITDRDESAIHPYNPVLSNQTLEEDVSSIPDVQQSETLNENTMEEFNITLFVNRSVNRENVQHQRSAVNEAFAAEVENSSNIETGITSRDERAPSPVYDISHVTDYYASQDPPELPSWNKILSIGYQSKIHKGLIRPAPSAPSLHDLISVPDRPLASTANLYGGNLFNSSPSHHRSLPDVSILSAFTRVQGSSQSSDLLDVNRSTGNIPRVLELERSSDERLRPESMPADGDGGNKSPGTLSVHKFSYDSPKLSFDHHTGESSY